VKQKMARMATLLGFHTRNPTREALLVEIQSKNVLQQVPQYLRDLYVLLEETSDPLVMVDQAKPLLDQLKQEVGATTSTEMENDDVSDMTLGRYVEPLTHVLLLKLIVNLSMAYRTVAIDKLKSLTAGLGMPFEQVEKSIVQFTQTKTLSVRIDHRAGCLRFGDANLESDIMRSQLTILAKKLSMVDQVLYPSDITNRLHERKIQFDMIRSNVDAEHAANLERKMFIEKRKEEAEKLAQEKIKAELRIKTEEDSTRKIEEERRMARELRMREQDKHKRIQMELENQEKKRVMRAMGKKLDDITEEEMAKIDTEALQKEHQAKINKEKEDADRKTKEAAKKLDYLVRAIRIEELPLIKRKYEEKIKLDRERYEQETIEKSQKAKEQWEADVNDKALLEAHSVFAYCAVFENSIIVDRKAKHAILCKEAEEQAEIAAEKAKMRRARRRRDDEIKQKEEEEAQQKEEEERKKAEEEARKKEEARREREAKEEEARQAERRRMEDERRRNETSSATSSTQPSLPTNSRFAAASSATSGSGATSGGGAGKYVPPSRRGGTNSTSTTGGGGGGGRNNEGRSTDDRSRAYPGGGRYEGRSSQGGGSNDRHGGDRHSGGSSGGGGAGSGWRK
jgi:translation initiation factor 3 subunit A